MELEWSRKTGYRKDQLEPCVGTKTWIKPSRGRLKKDLERALRRGPRQRKLEKGLEGTLQRRALRGEPCRGR